MCKPMNAADLEYLERQILPALERQSADPAMKSRVEGRLLGELARLKATSPRTEAEKARLAQSQRRLEEVQERVLFGGG